MALDFVNVSVRLRPGSKKNQNSMEIISSDPALMFIMEKQQTFGFDKIFNEDSSQVKVYNEIVLPLVEKVKEGYNCTIFAYGQTGTGKTYTMGTNPMEKEAGITTRALEDFFSIDEQEFDIYISFMEIYNEKVYDLLRDTKVPLTLQGFRVNDLSKERVFNVHEAKHFLKIGGQHRHTGETKQNLFSSRSHAVFSIHLEVSKGGIRTSAKLNLVDLAGSESVKKTGTQGNSFYEGININKGLLCIGQVMTALSSNSNYIPYRQSIITTILQDSLSKNNYISLIACVKTGMEDSNESIQTLEFAQRVKKIKNKPEINEVLTKFMSKNHVLFTKNSRSISTPYKKSMETPQKAIVFKKPNQTSTTATLNFNNSKSISCVSSNCESSNFSPVIRKYMSELENTVVSKLETVIQETLRRPRRSTRNSIQSDKENTPKYSWKQIEKKVTKLIKDEILQSTSRTSRATSSPLNNLNVDHAKMRLVYNSPIFEDTVTREVLNACRNSLELESDVFPIEKSNFEEADCFKKPTLSNRKLELITSRRSARLSSKKTTAEHSFSLNLDISKEASKIKNISQQDISIEVLKPRRSTRISLRRNSVHQKEHILNSSSYRAVIYECEQDESLAKPKKKLPKSHKVEIPKKRRTKEVLEIINQGDKKQLQKLATIGPKTAERILLFRHFKGKIKTIKELSDMPGWSSVYYKNFIDQNFLIV